MLWSLDLKKFFWGLVFLLSSSGLLIFSFPKFDFWGLAWAGLMPLFFVLDGKTRKQAFWISYICGLFFFAGTLYWIGYVTVFGATLLILYLALYFGLFGVGYSFFSWYNSSIKLFLLPSLWVVLEFIRDHALSGFGWASLGQSQYKNLWVIQIADITGMFGVSFLVVMVNVFFKELFTKDSSKNNFPFCFFIFRPFLTDFQSQFPQRSSLRLENHSIKSAKSDLNLKAKKGSYFCLNPKNRHRVFVWWPVVVLVGVLGYGIFRISTLSGPSSSSMVVGVVQANILQDTKWQESAWPAIIDKYFVLTKEVAKEDPDLIVWPETAFPGFLLKDTKYFQQLRELAADIDIPILFGSVTKDGDSYYNSAVLLSSKGEIAQRYDKRHLVPFGEYIPFRVRFPFLSEIIPIADFSSGKEYTVFSSLSLHNDIRTFSTLICFEDTMGQLAREFVKSGTGLLINITNDAWFKDTAAPFMHLQSAVFRTVENRRSLVRAANTGVSAVVDVTGKITNTVHNKKGNMIFVPGYITQRVSFNYTKTFYTKYGDIFAFVCFGCIIVAIIMTMGGRNKYEE